MIEKTGSLAELINKDEYMKENHFRKNHRLLAKTRTYQNCILNESHHSIIKGYNYAIKNEYQFILNKDELVINIKNKKNKIYVDSHLTFDYSKDIENLIYEEIDKDENIKLVYQDDWIEKHDQNLLKSEFQIIDEDHKKYNAIAYYGHYAYTKPDEYQIQPVKSWFIFIDQ